MQSTDFLAGKALSSSSPQNANMIPDSYFASNYAGIIATCLLLNSRDHKCLCLLPKKKQPQEYCLSADKAYLQSTSKCAQVRLPKSTGPPSN